MKGTRPLSKSELPTLAGAFSGRWAVRNKTLVILGCNVGLRISELLSLNIQDVAAGTLIVDSVYIRKSATKGKLEGRSIKLNKAAKAALAELLALYNDAKLPPSTPLFHVTYRGVCRMDRRQAWAVINDAAKKLGITGKLGTHCLRKTFADRVYDALGRDLARLQVALGHKWVTSTASYISFKQQDIDDAIDSIA